jgi:hypothetical protein
MRTPFFFLCFLFLVSFVFPNPIEDIQKLEAKEQLRAFFDYVATPKSTFLRKLLPQKIKSQKVYDKFMNIYETAKTRNKTVIQHLFNTYLEENNILKESWTCTQCKNFVLYLQGVDNSTCNFFLNKKDNFIQLFLFYLTFKPF